eukprot:255146_1
MGNANVNGDQVKVGIDIMTEVFNKGGKIIRRDFTVYNQSHIDMWFHCAGGDWKCIAKGGGRAAWSIKYDCPARVSVSKANNGPIIMDVNYGNMLAIDKIYRCYWDGHKFHKNYVGPNNKGDDVKFNLCDNLKDCEINLRSYHGRYLCVEAKECSYAVNAYREKAGPWERFRFMAHSNGTVSLRTHHNTFIVAEPNGKVNGDAKEAGQWEKFSVVKTDYGGIAFRSCHGKYLCAESDKHSVVCNRDKPLQWEKFNVVKTDYGGIAFRSCHGKYLCAESDKHSVVCNRDKPLQWETWYYN